jgi:hypothetical protein
MVTASEQGQAGPRYIWNPQGIAIGRLRPLAGVQSQGAHALRVGKSVLLGVGLVSEWLAGIWHRAQLLRSQVIFFFNAKKSFCCVGIILDLNLETETSACV